MTQMVYPLLLLLLFFCFVFLFFFASVLRVEGDAERVGTHPEAASHGIHLAGDSRRRGASSFPISSIMTVPGAPCSRRNPSPPNHVLQGGRTTQKRAFVHAREAHPGDQHWQFVSDSRAGEEQGGVQASIAGNRNSSVPPCPCLF